MRNNNNNNCFGIQLINAVVLLTALAMNLYYITLFVSHTNSVNNRIYQGLPTTRDAQHIYR